MKIAIKINSATTFLKSASIFTKSASKNAPMIFKAYCWYSDDNYFDDKNFIIASDTIRNIKDTKKEM